MPPSSTLSVTKFSLDMYERAEEKILKGVPVIARPTRWKNPSSSVTFSINTGIRDCNGESNSILCGTETTIFSGRSGKMGRRWRMMLTVGGLFPVTATGWA